jgi:hypothetical protein
MRGSGFEPFISLGTSGPIRVSLPNTNHRLRT